jgi:hypothetical protein
LPIVVRERGVLSRFHGALQSECVRVIYSHAIDPCSAATTSFETISLNFAPARGEINFSYKNTDRTTTTTSLCHSVASAHLPRERNMFMVTNFQKKEIKIDPAFVYVSCLRSAIRVARVKNENKRDLLLIMPPLNLK